jgi:hypothetical protein
MSWADIKKKYRDGGAMASQSTEDMAARRILRALGVTEKRLPAAEREYGLDVKRQADTTLLERSEALAARIGRFPRVPVRDVRSVQEATLTVLELAEQRKYDGTWPAALVYRVKGSEHLHAAEYVGPGDLLDLTKIPLPCRLKKSRDWTCVVLHCDAQDFYNSLVRRA